MPRHCARPGEKERSVQRRAQALELRIQGKRYATIAQEMGCSVAAAHNLVKKGLEKLTQLEISNAQQLRAIELERLDLAIEKLFPQVEKGSLPAIDRWLALVQARAKLLGLYSPLPEQTETTDGIALELISNGNGHSPAIEPSV